MSLLGRVFNKGGGFNMSDAAESEDKDQGFTIYGSIGVAVFLIIAGLVYLIPNTFPEGFLYVVAGVLIVIVTIANAFKGIAYDGLSILFAVVSIVIGVNKIVDVEIRYLPIILIVIGFVALLNNIKKLRYQ